MSRLGEGYVICVADTVLAVTHDKCNSGVARFMVTAVIAVLEYGGDGCVSFVHKFSKRTKVESTLQDVLFLFLIDTTV